ncbi:phosphatase PAP2 family protein [Oryzobacter telluris]|uniref:phosphatase PAP2 family protein n=1 Tax=Oryzobacter telluris TaxID=3149179 RepID=UPI00370DDA73
MSTTTTPTGLRGWLTASRSTPHQLALRVGVVTAAFAVCIVPVLLLALFVQTKWEPLLEVDDGARDSLHQYALAHPTFLSVMRVLSDLGSATSWQVLTVVVVVIALWRRRRRIAAFTVVTIAGSSLVNSALKAVIGRHRPVVDHPFVTPPGQSFPSGHAQAAAAGSLVLLIVLWPLMSGVRRWLALVLAIAVTLAIGFSRVALAAHYVSDVIAGYLVGAAWVAAMAAAFHIWRVDRVARALPE